MSGGNEAITNLERAIDLVIARFMKDRGLGTMDSPACSSLEIHQVICDAQAAVFAIRDLIRPDAPRTTATIRLEK